MSREIQDGEPAPAGAREPHAGRSSAAPGVVGFIDRIQGHRVSGWALDRIHPALPVEVRILVDGEEAALVQADRFRRDLERGGLSSGHHAFEATLEMLIEDGEAHRVEALARSAEGALVPLVNRPASSSLLAPVDPRPAPETHQVLLELRALRERIEALAAAGSEVPPATAGGTEDALATFAELLPGVVERLDALDVVQVRLEAAITCLEARLPAESGGYRTEGGLRVVVGLLAVLSVTSLLLGLRSVLG